MQKSKKVVAIYNELKQFVGDVATNHDNANHYLLLQAGSAPKLGQRGVGQVHFQLLASTDRQNLYLRLNILEDHAFIAYDTQLAHLLEQALPIDEHGDLSPRALVLSDAAYECWVDAYNAIEEASAPGGALENYQAYASKLAEQILRIAGVITTFEDPDAVEIPEATMRGAIQLGNYFLHEAMRLLLGPADRQLARAKELLEWLKRYPSPMALRDVYRTGPKFVRSAAQARELLSILMEHGWVRQHEGKLTSSDGKVSRENYAVVTDV